MTKIFTIINNKGGTGKTTTSLNLGATFAQMGHKVLLIDLDSQCNLSISLGVKDAENHVGTLLLGESNYENTIYELDNLWLLPSSEKLLDFESRISNEVDREYKLLETLDNFSQMFDYIIIDCPPSLGLMSMNALITSNYFIVPMQAENFAFIGLDKILQIWDKIKKRMNPKLKLAGILLIRFSHRTKFSQVVVNTLNSNEQLEDKLFDTYIRQDISLMESTAFGQDILEYSPKSRGAEDYINLANEIIEKYGKEN